MLIIFIIYEEILLNLDIELLLIYLRSLTDQAPLCKLLTNLFTLCNFIVHEVEVHEVFLQNYGNVLNTEENETIHILFWAGFSNINFQYKFFFLLAKIFEMGWDEAK